MFSGELKVGDRLIWRYLQPKAYAAVKVVRRRESRCFPDDPFLEVEAKDGWKCELPQSILRDYCMRNLLWRIDFLTFGLPKILDSMWDKQAGIAKEEYPRCSQGTWKWVID